MGSDRQRSWPARAAVLAGLVLIGGCGAKPETEVQPPPVVSTTDPSTTATSAQKDYVEDDTCREKMAPLTHLMNAIISEAKFGDSLSLDGNEDILRQQLDDALATCSHEVEVPARKAASAVGKMQAVAHACDTSVCRLPSAHEARKAINETVERLAATR